MTRKEQIKSAYKQLGGSASFYDGMITCSTLPGKAVCGLVWNMDSGKNTRYLELALSGVPEDFAGKLLEVPVGTGVLTMPVYKELPGWQQSLTHLTSEDQFPQQFKDEKVLYDSFCEAIVLSLNGFHAFPDKEAAYRETFRVLKPGGIFCGCFYVQGGCKRTDWFIKKMYVPRGFFTPPFETEDSLRKRLGDMYEEVSVSSVEGMGCFRCRKA